MKGNRPARSPFESWSTSTSVMSLPCLSAASPSALISTALRPASSPTGPSAGACVTTTTFCPGSGPAAGCGTPARTMHPAAIMETWASNARSQKDSRVYDSFDRPRLCCQNQWNIKYSIISSPAGTPRIQARKYFPICTPPERLFMLRIQVGKHNTRHNKSKLLKVSLRNPSDITGKLFNILNFTKKISCSINSKYLALHQHCFVGKSRPTYLSP